MPAKGGRDEICRVNDRLEALGGNFLLERQCGVLHTATADVAKHQQMS